MEKVTIGFIGGGNMARSLIGGLINNGIEPTALCVSDPNTERLKALHDEFAVLTTGNNQQIVDDCDVVVLAIKPQVMKSVATAIDTTQQTSTLFITIAAGIRLASLTNWLGEVPLVRAMPNTPALVQSGATALYANPLTTANQRDTAESILRAVGLALWVEDEAQMDAVTALSGSGPAYYFLVMEAMERAGQRLGLSAKTASLLTRQTAFGAAKLALEIEQDSAVLRERVTSPGGTTEQAIKVLQDGELTALFDKALQAAHDRAIELAKELGE